MKALKLSSLSLLLISIFYSCTKDASRESVQESQSPVSRAKVGVAAVEKNTKPALTPAQNPLPVTKGNQVTVSYTATDAATGAPLECGRITIYQWVNEAWVQVAHGNAPSVSAPAITATTTAACAYKFRAGFDPGGNGTQCQGTYTGVDYLTQSDYCVNVTEACVSEFSIKGDVSAVPKGNGLYEFTITYTLTSPRDVSGVHFQGGATAGGNSGHAITDLGNFAYVHINNNNTVLGWNGDLKACTPQVLTFKYTRNFSCPASGELVTGDWSASAGGTALGTIAKLPYSCQ